ncbi:MAG: polysaccharide deacetylase family protein [Chitinophagales bacterium]|nr:polysaccharide deacetylase family protein [Chitinophagales bacterium]
MLDALIFTKTPLLLKAVYPECIWKVDANEKVLYLTFDDGPIPEVTPFVLAELKKWNAKATFFCIGKNAEANPEILKQALDEGHSIGNHTYDHLNGWKTSDEVYFENIERCKAALSAYCLPPVANVFRPPYGKLKPSQYATLKSKYSIVMWDVLSYDFDLAVPKEKVLGNVLQNAEVGSVVVFHDSLKAKEKVLYALPKVLEHFSAQGFKFEALC